MIRSAVLKQLIPVISDHIVVCNIGLPSQEMHMLDDQPTYAGKKTSLTAVAKACDCENFVECQAEEAAATVKAALDSDKMTIIVCKCESGNVKVPVITMDPVVIRDRFMKELQARNG